MFDFASAPEVKSSIKKLHFSRMQFGLSLIAMRKRVTENIELCSTPLS